MDQIILLPAIAATFLVAGFVKGVTGMGLPTLAMGVLGALLGPASAAALLLLPSFVTNVWQLAAGPHLGTLLHRLWPMMTAIVLGTLAGSAMLASGDTAHTTTALGVVLVVYALYTLLARPLVVPPGWEAWASPVMGLATGLVTGATGVFVIPAVPYLQSLRLDRDALVQALGLSFTVSTLALGAGLFWHGTTLEGEWLLSAGAVLPALLGMALGQTFRGRISALAFRRVFLGGLLVLGSEMASRPFV